MSMTPPPGWYRDPSAPHVERWWDGTAWTEHRRTPEAPTPQQPQAQPQFAPTEPTMQLASGGGSGRAKSIALVAAASVLVAAIVTGAVVLNGDDGDPEAKTAPTPTSSAPTSASPSPSESTSEPSAD